ncbi:hypothetical protein [Corallococcus sp. Z5C101001]|uniref:hypothetical protein n=1 Tax=Corallococcus sp. Z5C101001 TaxID=2596829 RepID=UPI00117CAEEF|nr:hypothetical protein [Corallococcus sp. Z5C101001]TSC23279.1 hypothetical protein FOF48_29675 [Corallococcus sp. Z5C101001]
MHFKPRGILILAACAIFTVNCASKKENVVITDPDKIAIAVDPQLACIQQMSAFRCPVGSDPTLGADDGFNCAGELGASVKDEEGKIKGACGTKNNCKYTCAARSDYCKCGIQRATLAEITCMACPETPKSASTTINVDAGMNYSAVVGENSGTIVNNNNGTVVNNNSGTINNASYYPPSCPPCQRTVGGSCVQPEACQVGTKRNTDSCECDPIVCPQGERLKIETNQATCVPLPSVTLKSAVIKFQQTSNDKDWNTQVFAYLKCPNTVASLECCSSDKRGDYWPDPGVQTKMMTVSEGAIRKESIGACTLSVGSRASGNDKWEFIPSLHLEFSDNSTRDFTFGQMSLNSRGGNYAGGDHKL